MNPANLVKVVKAFLGLLSLLTTIIIARKSKDENKTDNKC